MRMRFLDPRAILIITGVSGSGKTTVGTALAQRLGWPLQEGDEFDPRASAKMRSPHPLDVRDQWSWLTKVTAWIDDCRRRGTGGVITSLLAGHWVPSIESAVASVFGSSGVQAGGSGL